MRRLLALPLLAVATLAAAGPSQAQDEALPLATPLQLNVDKDPELETIRVREVRCFGGESETPPCAVDDPNIGRDLTIELVNVCNGVEKATPLLVRTENFVTAGEAVEIDGDTTAKEFIVGAASGASGRNGQLLAGAVRDKGDGCPTFKRLMSLGPRTAKTVKPKGSSYFATGGLSVKSLRKDFKGKEIIVSQPWYRSSDAGCCPGFVSTSYYRYRSSTDSYVRFRSKIERTRAE